MQQRTWEYGSTLTASVIDFMVGAIVLTDEHGEGHVLMGSNSKIGVPEKGDSVTMTFTKGGPTGGYWEITAINN